MGVRGLTTYINSNHDKYLNQLYLHDTNLVIDGHSLCAQLYRSMNSYSAFGGDYDKFAAFVRTFFKNLRKCNITSFILFDGCHESRKLRTIYSRLRNKIRGCSQLDPVTQDSLQIFPFLVRDVFREVLTDMNIQYATCNYEADGEIASLARHLNCPVLSYDSDFFIYNVLYIPFNVLELKPRSIKVNGNRTHAMNCEVYNVKHFCDSFGGLKEELLPLLATLLGNDYVEKKVFTKFFSELKLKKIKGTKNDAQKTIHTLFYWLQNETLESAISKILGRLKKHEKNKVFKIIKENIECYHSTHTKLLKYFHIPENLMTHSSSDFQFNIQFDSLVEEEDSEESVSSDEESSQEEITPDTSDCNEEEDTVTPNLEDIPSWLSNRIRRNRIPTVYLNLYAHSLMFCNPQAEDFSNQDSFVIVLPIVRYAFDILTDFSQESFLYVGRENCNYRKQTIDREHALPRPSNIPFKDLTNAQLKLYFQHFLKIKLPRMDLEVIELLPSSFRLFMISLLWWIAHCNVPANHVHSLIISYIMLEVVVEKTGTSRSHYHFNQKHAKKLEELKKANTELKHDSSNDLFLNKNKVQYEDCVVAASVLLQHFQIDSSVLKRPKRNYDIKKVHSFAQFQCALHQVNSLNILCGSPYQSTFYSKCYNGTFVYNIALKLENQMDPAIFLKQYLKGASTVIQFYKSICTIYKKLMEMMNLSTVQLPKKGRGRRKKKDDEISFIVKGFESDLII